MRLSESNPGQFLDHVAFNDFLELRVRGPHIDRLNLGQLYMVYSSTHKFLVHNVIHHFSGAIKRHLTSLRFVLVKGSQSTLSKRSYRSIPVKKLFFSSPYEYDIGTLSLLLLWLVIVCTCFLLKG